MHIKLYPWILSWEINTNVLLRSETNVLDLSLHESILGWDILHPSFVEIQYVGFVKSCWKTYRQMDTDKKHNVSRLR